MFRRIFGGIFLALVLFAPPAVAQVVETDTIVITIDGHDVLRAGVLIERHIRTTSGVTIQKFAPAATPVNVPINLVNLDTTGNYPAFLIDQRDNCCQIGDFLVNNVLTHRFSYSGSGAGNIELLDGGVSKVLISSDTQGIRFMNPLASIGYGTGAGGAVTQLTNKTTGVTLNTITGKITMDGAALAAAAEACFTVTNSAITAPDVVILNHGSAGTAGAYTAYVGAIGAGSFSACVSNVTAGSLSEAIVLNFATIKGSIN